MKLDRMNPLAAALSRIEVSGGNISRDLITTRIIKDPTNPLGGAVKVRVGGRYRGIAIGGKSLTFYIGIDDPDNPAFVDSGPGRGIVPAARRADGSGRDLPYKARRLINDSVIAAIKQYIANEKKV